MYDGWKKDRRKKERKKKPQNENIMIGSIGRP